MKLAKRILVPVLVIALLASVFAFTTVAVDDREYDYTLESITKAEQILEYYALDDYLADNYEDGTWDAAKIKATALAAFKPTYKVVADPLNADNNVLSVTLPRAKTALGYTLSADGNELLTDRLIVSSRVYFDATATKGLEFKLNVGLRNGIEETSRYYDIIKVDMKNGGALTYAGWDETQQVMVADANTYADWQAQTGAWYDFLITFNAEDDIYNVVVKSVPTDGSEPEVLASSGNVSIKGAIGMSGFNVTATATGTGVSCCFDDFEIYEGSTTRSPSIKEKNTDIHVEDLVKFYNETEDFATKVRIADVFYDLSAVYGVTLVNAEAYTQMNAAIAQEFLNRVEKIDSTLEFFDRADWVDAISLYNDKLADNDGLLDLPGITEDLAAAVVAAREIFLVEKAEIDVVREHSDNLIDFLTNVYDENNTDYLQMKAWFAEIHDQYVAENPDFADYDTEKYPYQTRFYTLADIRYGELPNLMDKYNAFEKKVAEIDAAIADFTAKVDEMEAAATFGPRFVAYVEATEIYNDGVIHEGLDNSTNAKLAERIAYYLEQQPIILEKQAQCEYFIDLVNQTAYASYYTVLVEKIDLAVAAYEFIEPDYEDIAESITLYASLLELRKSMEAEASAYIAAVEAIAEAEGFYAKKEAVRVAAEYKVKGDVLGYEGVEEANIAFSEADADVKFRENSSMSLIKLVAQINDLMSAESYNDYEVRSLLRLADVAYENADDEINGVSVAKAAFDTAVEEFKADCAVTNEIITAATDTAAAIAGAVKGASIYNK